MLSYLTHTSLVLLALLSIGFSYSNSLWARQYQQQPNQPDKPLKSSQGNLQIGIEDILKQSIEGLKEKNCLRYCVTGLCVGFTCAGPICLPVTNARVSHRLPDLIVAGYSGEHPFDLFEKLLKPINKVLNISPHTPSSRAGMPRRALFKEAMVIGNPIDLGKAGVPGLCKMKTKALQPHFSSTADAITWRDSVASVRNFFQKNKSFSGEGGKRWGWLYPRNGHVRHSAATVANMMAMHRAVDIVEVGGGAYISRQSIPLQAAEDLAKRKPLSFQERIKQACWQILTDKPSQDSKQLCQVLGPSMTIEKAQQRAMAALLWTDYECCLPIPGATFTHFVTFGKPLCID